MVTVNWRIRRNSASCFLVRDLTWLRCCEDGDGSYYMWTEPRVWSRVCWLLGTLPLAHKDICDVIKMTQWEQRKSIQLNKVWRLFLCFCYLQIISKSFFHVLSVRHKEFLSVSGNNKLLWVKKIILFIFC